MARRFFGCVREPLSAYTAGERDPMARISLMISKEIQKHKIRDWRENPDALNRMRGEIDDIIFEIARKENLEIPIEVHDKLIDECIDVAIANEDA